jgi:CubicO group peptidase (beta-lactamase class C family)
MVDAERIESFISAELEGRRHPGSSVSVVKGDEVVWSRGFGYSDLKNDKRATPETIYGCASVTKPVVTTGFLQLMEQEKFSLDDGVNEHLDVKIRDIKGEEPTIRDLLTHYTGMPTRVPPLYLLGEAPMDTKRYISEAARMVRPRGEEWTYCNTAFTIVGHLIETFTGTPYNEYVKEHVLKPLEMTSSDFEISPMVEARLAQGYKRGGGPEKPLIPCPRYYLGMRPADAAGSLYSTVLDLAKFVSMNLNHGTYHARRLLKEETIAEMHRLQAPTGKSSSGMGLTWFRTIHDGRVMLYHTGGLPDFTNHVCFYPEEGLGVCWLSNMQDGSNWRPPAPTVLRMAHGDEPPRASLQSTPNNWSKIVGVYGDETHQSTIRVVNGYLVLDEKLLLERLDDSTYRVHGPSSDGEDMTLEYGENGNVRQFDLGTSFHLRYTPTVPRVDNGADLVGTWIGEYVDAYGFHDMELRIQGRGSGVANGPNGEYVKLDGFRAELGEVKGRGSFRIPREYALWGTSDYAEVELSLKSVEGKLVGILTSNFGATKIELKRK